MPQVGVPETDLLALSVAGQGSQRPGLVTLAVSRLLIRMQCIILFWACIDVNRLGELVQMIGIPSL